MLIQAYTSKSRVSTSRYGPQQARMNWHSHGLQSARFGSKIRAFLAFWKRWPEMVAQMPSTVQGKGDKVQLLSYLKFYRTSEARNARGEDELRNWVECSIFNGRMFKVGGRGR